MPEEPAYPGQEALADSAYSSKDINEKLQGRGYVPEINEKGYRNKPLTEDQKATNNVKSSVRCRVEHGFGEMKMRMGDTVFGIKRRIECWHIFWYVFWRMFYGRRWVAW